MRIPTLSRIIATGETAPAPAASPDDAVVELRWATLPSVLALLAVHHWFAVFDPEARVWERWEVWQSQNAGGTSWGHVHKDLMRMDRGVGGGRAVVQATWRDEDARRIRDVLGEPSRYPNRDRYRAWPGPNSNTYVAWVLAEAGVACDLGRRAIGKDFAARRRDADRVHQPR